MEYEKCYVYEPPADRPAKRRRTDESGLQASWALRRKAYRQAWPAVQHALSSSLRSVNQGTVDAVSTFLAACRKNPRGKKVAAAFILTGASISSDASIMQRAVENSADSTAQSYALVSSSEAGSLRSILKSIIRKIIASNDVVNYDDEYAARDEKSQPRLLKYDLQLIANHVKEKRIDQVVIGLLDTEALDDYVLSGLLELLGYWKDRIPLVFLFNIGTNVENLQERLSKEACKLIAGRAFDVAPVAENIEQAFDTMITFDTLPRMGTDLMTMLMERQREHILSIDALLDSFQYAFMACHYANALSVFLDTNILYQQIPADHFEAARNLATFQSFCSRLLDNRELDRLTQLLESDEALFDLIRTEIEAGHRALRGLVTALDVIRSVQRTLNPAQGDALSTLYSQAMSNTLQSSTTLRGLLLSIRKSPSTTAAAILELLSSPDAPSALHQQCKEIQVEFNNLLSHQSDSKQPLKSEEDVEDATHRRTVVAHKVALSKRKSALSKQDTAYTAVLRRLTDVLEAYFKEVLVDPTSLVFNEIFLYDLTSPHHEVFIPKPRQAVERALATPHDYMDCKCCRNATVEGQNGESTLAPSQPATALLYQLYLESEALINVNDLWEAFKTIRGIGDGEKDGDGEGQEEGDGEKEGGSEVHALFQRGLAELQYLGFIRFTARREDHVAKAAWGGL